MRARLAILLSQQVVQLRPITMKDKPEDMVNASPKATVPVLILRGNAIQNEAKKKVIDESLDIMLWALHLNDPDNLLYAHQENALAEMLSVIDENDSQFKSNLEQYKRAKRFHGEDQEQCRLRCEPFVQQLEKRLSQHKFLMGPTPSLLDFALLPFIRQFAKVNKSIFAQDQYSNLREWLRHHLESRLFAKAMFKYPLWLETHEVCLFGE